MGMSSSIGRAELVIANIFALWRTIWPDLAKKSADNMKTELRYRRWVADAEWR
jgi:hypothetical protein